MGVILRLTATIAKLHAGRDDDAESFTVASSLVCFVRFHTTFCLSFFLSFITCLRSVFFLYFFPSLHLKFASALHILYNIRFLISNPPFQLPMRS